MIDTRFKYYNNNNEEKIYFASTTTTTTTTTEEDEEEEEAVTTIMDIPPRFTSSSSFFGNNMEVYTGVDASLSTATTNRSNISNNNNNINRISSRIIAQESCYNQGSGAIASTTGTTTTTTTSSSNPRGGQPKLLSKSYTPGKYTVICGRGRICTNASGNKYLSKIVNTYLTAYSKCTNKTQKSEIVSHILIDIKKAVAMSSTSSHDETNNDCGRSTTTATASTRGEGDDCNKNGGGNGGNGNGNIVFVKIDEKGRYWHVHDSIGREKIGGILRDRLHAKYKSSSKSKIAKRKAMMKDTVYTSSGDVGFCFTPSMSSMSGTVRTDQTTTSRNAPSSNSDHQSRNRTNQGIFENEEQKTHIENLYRHKNTATGDDGNARGVVHLNRGAATQYPAVASIVAGGEGSAASQQPYLVNVANDLTSAIVDESIFDSPAVNRRILPSSSLLSLSSNDMLHHNSSDNYHQNQSNLPGRNSIVKVLNQACGIVSTRRRMGGTPNYIMGHDRDASMVSNMSNVIGSDDDVTNLFSSRARLQPPPRPPAATSLASATVNRSVVPPATGHPSSTATSHSQGSTVEGDWDRIFQF